jgi:hypothetical protein
MTFLIPALKKVRFRLFPICFSIFCAFPAITKAQGIDTSILTMYSDPFFYNVIKTHDGALYAGTSRGVYRIEDETLEQLDARKGYLTVNEKGEPVIDPDGIRYHEEKSFSHLLPWLGETKNTFAAGNEDHLYITSGGRLHIFQIRPFGYTFRNHSIRTISPHFTGTYSGIYHDGRKMADGFPTFCDGYIREWNGKVFVCYSDLSIYEPVAGADPSAFRQLPRPAGLNFDYCRDVVYSRQAGCYFMNTKRQFSRIESNLMRGDSLFNSPSDQDEVVILGEDTSRNEMIFASGNRLMSYSYASDTTKQLSTLPEQILDGHINRLNFYLLCASGLFVRHADGKIERLAVTENAHTLRKTSENLIVIGTDHGLFLFNATTKNLETLIEGVEFNRRALAVEGNRLYAGSIDGVYSFETGRLEILAGKTSAHVHARQGADHSWWIITMLMSVLILGSGILLIRYRRRIKTLQEEISHNADLPFTKDDVIRYISEHLPTVSLNAINTHFETNSTQVYTILEPEKPGALIQQMRLEKVMEMRKGGARAREISLITGLSESYIRKIWNKD